MNFKFAQSADTTSLSMMNIRALYAIPSSLGKVRGVN